MLSRLCFSDKPRIPGCIHRTPPIVPKGGGIFSVGFGAFFRAEFPNLSFGCAAVSFRPCAQETQLIPALQYQIPHAKPQYPPTFTSAPCGTLPARATSHASREMRVRTTKRSWLASHAFSKLTRFFLRRQLVLVLKPAPQANAHRLMRGWVEKSQQPAS